MASYFLANPASGWRHCFDRSNPLSSRLVGDIERFGRRPHRELVFPANGVSRHCNGHLEHCYALCIVAGSTYRVVVQGTPRELRDGA